MYLNYNLTEVFIPDIKEKNPNRRELKLIRSLNQTGIFSSIIAGDFIFHQIIEGETYWSLAVDYYENQDMWIYIYYANMVHPVDIRPGDVIIVPRLDKITQLRPNAVIE